EIWISEAQERMVLAVPQENVEALQAICDKYGVEMCDLGEFGTDDAELVLKYDGNTVGQISMSFLHDGLPGTTRIASWSPVECAPQGEEAIDIEGILPKLLAHPNIASKQSIIQQYDHEVQGRSVVRPLVGPLGDAPSDAAVITPVRGSSRGLAIGSGLATGLSADPYTMAAAAIDECVRNIVCVGGDPDSTAILDNFCWPSANDEASLGRLVRCAHGCYDAAKAYRTPFISGKDSLNNQFTKDDGETIYIPPTLLVSGFSIVEDIEQCVTMDAKQSGHKLFLVGQTTDQCGGSHALLVQPNMACDTSLPEVDLTAGPANARAVHKAIKQGLVQSAHDLSEGGLLVALAEIAFGGGLGIRSSQHDLSDLMLVAETPSRYLIEVAPSDVEAFVELMGATPCQEIGEVNDSNTLVVGNYTWDCNTLKSCWLEGMVI
ncbi:MAG: AIR synthase-related protein, partial [Phycisphaerales bacterium]|nr:AIR synthase-related protein [Phycisphaerales bacterium]